MCKSTRLRLIKNRRNFPFHSNFERYFIHIVLYIVTVVQVANGWYISFGVAQREAEKRNQLISCRLETGAMKRQVASGGGAKIKIDRGRERDGRGEGKRGKEDREPVKSLVAWIGG